MKLGVTFAAVVVSSLTAGALYAQQSGDTIPKELVQLLLRGPSPYPNDNFDIKIGLPDNFPKELLPAGSKAVVSTTSERMMTVVAEAPGISDLQAYEMQLAASGWANQSGMMMRGLTSSMSATQSLSMCKGDHYAMLGHSPRSAGGSYIRISLTIDPRRGMCSNAARPMSYFADVTLPIMPPPPDSRAMGGGGGSYGSDTYDQRMRVQTKLTPVAVVSHYVSILEKAGWKIDSRADTPGVAFARLSTLSSIKDPIVAVISVVPMPSGTEYDVSLRLLRTDPNRRWPGDPMPSRGVIGGVVGGLPGGSTCCS